MAGTTKKLDPSAQPAERPTLKTIAALSGLAVTTVSRALNEAPDIGLKTRKRVRDIADQIGYVPDRAGVRLRTGKTNVISMVLCSDHDAMNHTAKLISAIANELRDTSYHLNITPFFLDEDPMRPIRYIVENRTADAVIFNRTQPDDPRVAYLLDVGMPFATHGRSNMSDKHSYFDFDNEAFGRLAVEELAAQGSKNIVMLAPPLEQAYAHHMITGARTAANQLGIAFDVVKGTSSDDSNDQMTARMLELLSSRPEIDAVICGSQTGTIATISAAEAVGRSIGRDFMIFAKEGSPLARIFRPEVMTVKEDIGRAGAFLAQAAMAAIKNPSAPPMQELDVPVS